MKIPSNIMLTKPFRQNIILKQAKDKGQIIYGARSIQAQLGVVSRQTEDWDVFAKQPQSSAKKVEKQLDKQIGFDYYYTQPGMHKGTYKVKSRGYDLRKGTKDDEGIADYTTTPRPTPKFVMINGIRYRKLNEEKRAKAKAIRDPNYKFRRQKDSNDLGLIRSVQRASNLKRRTFPKTKWRRK